MLSRSPHRHFAAFPEAAHLQNAREWPCAAQAP
jgi:hypothetical protein